MFTWLFSPYCAGYCDKSHTIDVEACRDVRPNVYMIMSDSP